MNRKILAAAVLAALLPLGAQAQDNDDDVGLSVSATLQLRLLGEQRGCESGTAEHGWLARSLRVAALTPANAQGQQSLLCVDENNPQFNRSRVLITGVNAGERLVGMDYRPQDGRLYAVGTQGGVYLLDPRTGQASGRVQLFTSAGGVNTNVVLDDAFVGVDFNAAANRLRIVTSTGRNLRAAVAADGATQAGLTAIDVALNNGAGVPVLGIQTTAYTNNDVEMPVAPAVAATGVTQYVMNGVTGQLAIQSTPNSGVLFNSARSESIRKGLVSERASLDIHSTLRQGLAVRNEALVALREAAAGGKPARSVLYAIDPATGRDRELGAFGTEVLDIAIPLNQK